VTKAPKSSLALRTSILAIAVAVITALIAGFISVKLVSDADMTGARQTLSSLADSLATQLDNTPARSVAAIKKLKIDSAVITRRGRVVSTGPLPGDALSLSQLDSVLAGNSISVVQSVDGESTLVEARPLTYGAVVLIQPVSAAVPIWHAVVERLLLALIVSCVVAALLGVVVSRRIAKPIDRAAKAALALAGGRRDVVVDPDGPREVAEVAFAINTLTQHLSRSESRQRDFLLSVSHDLRTPLTAIRGYAESLADGMVTGDDIQRVGEVLQGEAERLDRYVSDLLDLARLDAQELRIQLVPVDLGALIDAAASVWSARCAPEQVELRVERPPQQVRVSTDPARLRQALDGLLENALRVVPPGAPIVLASRLESDPSGRVVALAEVRDGGPGLTDEDLTVAFERSALYDRYRGVRQVGTGLGLAIVHQLVTRLGGTVEAGHASEGGARFTIRLPCDSPPPPTS
jgi:two-component system, OmpR family, sensor kinase